MALHMFELKFEIEFDDVTDLIKFTTTNNYDSPNECIRKAERNNLKTVRAFIEKSNHEAIDSWLGEKGLS